MQVVETGEQTKAVVPMKVKTVHLVPKKACSHSMQSELWLTREMLTADEVCYVKSVCAQFSEALAQE